MDQRDEKQLLAALAMVENQLQELRKRLLKPKAGAPSKPRLVIRIDSDLIERTDAVAERLHASRSDVIRLALRILLETVERNGGLTIRIYDPAPDQECGASEPSSQSALPPTETNNEPK